MSLLSNLTHTFKPAVPKRGRADQTKGHRASAPGLRGHSCGDLYPYTIVARNFGREFGVQHALGGQVTWGFRSQTRAERAALIAKAGA